MRTDMGCDLHYITDCGCLGYPNLQTFLRNCGQNCADWRPTERCIRCQAADMIDRYRKRSERHLERIIELQNTLDTIQTAINHIYKGNDNER